MHLYKHESINSIATSIFTQTERPSRLGMRLQLLWKIPHETRQFLGILGRNKRVSNTSVLASRCPRKQQATSNSEETMRCIVHRIESVTNHYVHVVSVQFFLVDLTIIYRVFMYNLNLLIFAIEKPWEKIDRKFKNNYISNNKKNSYL